MKFVYCSECGKVSHIFRKAMPGYNLVVDMVQPHVCTDEPVQFDPKPDPLAPHIPEDKKGKFAKRLDNMQPMRTAFPLEENQKELRDRRGELPREPEKTTTAPQGVLDGLSQEIDKMVKG